MGPQMSHMFEDNDGRNGTRGTETPPPIPAPLAPQPPQPPQPPEQHQAARRPPRPMPAPRVRSVRRVVVGDDFWGELRRTALPWLRLHWEEARTRARAVMSKGLHWRSPLAPVASLAPFARHCLTGLLVLAFLIGVVVSVQFVHRLGSDATPNVPGMRGGGIAPAGPTATPTLAPTYTPLPANTLLAPTATALPPTHPTAPTGPTVTSTATPKDVVFKGTITLIYFGSAPINGYVFVTGCGGNYYVCYCTNGLAPGGWMPVVFQHNGTLDLPCTVDFAQVQNFPPPYPAAIPALSFQGDAQISATPGATPAPNAVTVYWENDQPFTKQSD